MATVNIGQQTFEKTISDNDIVVVDFWAEWCRPCLKFGPIFEGVSEDHPDVVFAKVDTEAEQELAMAARITSIPTLWVFREGIQVFANPGGVDRKSLESLVENVKALDMDKVREQIAEQEKATSENTE